MFLMMLRLRSVITTIVVTFRRNNPAASLNVYCPLWVVLILSQVALKQLALPVVTGDDTA